MSLRPLLRCLPLAAIAIVAACSERLDTSNNCPLLCQPNTLVVRDTTFDIVQSDSAFGGFTGSGERWRAPALPTADASGFLYETFVPVVNRPDSVDIRQVFRFDTLPGQLSGTDTTSITSVTSSRLLLVIDTSRSVLPTVASTVSLYDIDDITETGEVAASVLASRFTPSRLIATRTFTRADVFADTIPGSGAAVTIRQFSVTIPDSVMLRFIRTTRRARLGLRVTSATSTALSFVAPPVNAGGLTPRISYDPSPDTLVQPWVVPTKFIGNAVVPSEQRAQTVVVRDITPVRNDGSLEVGGIVGVRSVMTVKIPRRFLDTITVVRASLDLTQRPQRTMPGSLDPIRIRLRVAIAGVALSSEPRRLAEVLDPTIEGVQLPSLRLAPADSGVKAFDVGSALRLWQAQDSTLGTSFVLFSEGETFQPQRLAFFSRRSATATLRPRLRVTYTTRREGAIP